jgi:DNA end-binding protein Ku
LSAIARAITGTAWSGPRFFALKSAAKQQDAFAVIREAMRSKALVALGRIVLAKRERVMALEPYDKGFIGTMLRYPYEVRSATNYFADIPELTPSPELLRLAAHILDGKLQAFDPSGFRDRYEEALMAHLTAKQAGMPARPTQSWSAPRRAVNLMEALRRSIAADKAEAAPRPVPARKRA